jgi:hypothetical protein
MPLRNLFFFLAGLSLTAALPALGAAAAAKQEPPNDPRLTHGFRRAEKDGWIYVHLEGLPGAIGFQHGYLLAPEIEDNQKAIELSTTHAEKKTWADLRELAQKYFWPKVPAEYRAELQGMVEGLRARGSHLDVIDLVTMNAYMEFSYYDDELKRRAGFKVDASPAEHCSAFVATGSYTKDGRVVIGHNNWTDYLTATRWNVIFDLVPTAGHHILMDGMPGLIHSADDFGINDAGIMITETTISNFHGFDEHAVPEFVRARKAMQYSESIDDFARLMEDGNNGGYANTWLVADRKNNEIARLELGLKNVILERTKDGYYAGANYPVNPKLAAEETDYPVGNPEAPDSVRRLRWDQLMAEYKGKIDVAAGQKFETDHYDALTKEIDPNERTLCGHIDKSGRGVKGWQEPYGPAGVAQAKVADAAMAERMSFAAGMGHPCGVEFHAAEHLKEHPEFEWQKPLLRDIKANPWSVVSAAPPGETGSSRPGGTN